MTFLETSADKYDANQLERVLRGLRQGPLSTFDIIRRYNCVRPARVVSDLKRKGHDIRTEIVRRDRTHWAVYHLHE